MTQTPTTTDEAASALRKKKGRSSRRKFLLRATCAAAAVFVDMRFVEPTWLMVGRHRVPILPENGASIRILQLSDLHVSGDVSLAFIEKAVELASQEKPDLICLTGDFITLTWDDWRGYSEVLRPLTQLAPTYATTGNHDGGEWMEYHGGYRTPAKVIDMLEGAGIEVLMNKRADIHLPGKPPIELMGFGDWWAKDFHPYQLLEGPAPSVPRVVMSHNPDTKDLIGDLGWDLMLSGHTHGGQLTLPWGSTPFAPVKDHRFVRGLHQWQDHWLYITKGVGSIKKMRLNCFPEISVVDLVAKPA